ncbi:hypothetical protein J2S09_004086 [Bacillus fengqiuensis]|nr:hypothetical protein [Bacillus fengqiuensis]
MEVTHADRETKYVFIKKDEKGVKLIHCNEIPKEIIPDAAIYSVHYNSRGKKLLKLYKKGRNDSKPIETYLWDYDNGQQYILSLDQVGKNLERLKEESRKEAEQFKKELEEQYEKRKPEYIAKVIKEKGDEWGKALEEAAKGVASFGNGVIKVVEIVGPVAIKGYNEYKKYKSEKE